MNIAPIEELAASNAQGLRGIQMVGECSTEDIESVNYFLLDDMLSAGIIRTNRPEPTDKENIFQLRRVIQMNESDFDWIERIANYKKDIEVSFSGTIPLTEYQQSWVDYIIGKTKVKLEGTIKEVPNVLLVNIKGIVEEEPLPF